MLSTAALQSRTFPRFSENSRVRHALGGIYGDARGDDELADLVARPEQAGRNSGTILDLFLTVQVGALPFSPVVNEGRFWPGESSTRRVFVHSRAAVG
jgi:hypothetical protein